MSQHRLKSIIPDIDVVVGWDRPLQHFFAQVFDNKSEFDMTMLSFSEKNIEMFMEKVIKDLPTYAWIPGGLQAVLAADVFLDYPASNRIVTWNETEIVREVEF